MPTISKEKRFDCLGNEYDRSVKILKDGIFRISLPGDVSLYFNCKEATGATLDEARKNECQMLQSYKNAGTKVDYYICIRFLVTNGTRSEIGKHLLQTMSFSYGFGLCLQAEKLKVTTIEKPGESVVDYTYNIRGSSKMTDKMFKYENEKCICGRVDQTHFPSRGDDPSKRNDLIIWSQEAEDSLFSIGQKMNILAGALFEILSPDKIKIGLNLENTKKLLGN